jgi:hypothetical protein
MEAIMKAKGYHHKLISYGPGGYHCPCCGPSPKHRQRERRFVRKIEERLLTRIERSEESFDERAHWDEVSDSDELSNRASNRWHEFLDTGVYPDF